jgi:2-amino-4-hydroxy-6-hydroxymethyldihydropteridine diphosphokinase
VAALQTELSPLELLDELQRIEQAHGRVRSLKWGPRTLDLDLLLYGDQVIQNARLNVPHLGIGERAFVLLPLFELAPRLEIPGLGAISDVLAGCNTKGVEKWMA